MAPRSELLPGGCTNPDDPSLFIMVAEIVALAVLAVLIWAL